MHKSFTITLVRRVCSNVGDTSVIVFVMKVEQDIGEMYIKFFKFHFYIFYNKVQLHNMKEMERIMFPVDEGVEALSWPLMSIDACRDHVTHQ